MNNKATNKPSLKNFRINKLPLYAKTLLRHSRRIYYKYGPFALLQKIRLHILKDHKGAWKYGRSHELSYWKEALDFDFSEWPKGELQRRLNPNSELQAELSSLVPLNTASTPRVLDVGSGPLTSLGKNINGAPIKIVCIDPLADDYLNLTQNTDFAPLIKPQNIPGEEITQHFTENSFDLAHARNSLDHAYEPAEVIRQMLWTVKPGCHLFLQHIVNEADRNEYKGFHQWNFHSENGSFIIKSTHNTINLSEELSEFAEINCTQKEELNLDWLIVVIKKTASFTL